MKKIREMIESAPTKMAAIEMLNTWQAFGKVSADQYKKGRELIRKLF